jgi:hypothetical protein
MYKVYYMNAYLFTTTSRDEAVEKILNRVELGGGRTAYEDYEILDGSDFL